MTSTISGGSPLSYVEFSGIPDDSSTANNKSTCTKRLETHPEEEGPCSHVPDDSKLTFLPKLLAVELMSNNSAVVQIALEQLCGMCSEEANIHAILKHGGHFSLVIVLRQWSSNGDIQAAGLAMLHRAAESLEFCSSVVELGALDLVLVGMKNHCRNEDVLTAGCGALLNLTVPADHAKRLVFEFRGIRVVCDSCRSFPTNITLRKYALWIIQYMSYWEDFKTLLVEDGGEEALVDMVECFSGKNEAILKSVIATLNRIQ